MDTLPDKELRPQFRRELRALRSHVFTDVRCAVRGRECPRLRRVAISTHGRSLPLPVPPRAAQLVHPKTMHGQLVTGRMLSGLTRAYVDALNANAVPSLGNAWDGVTRVECKVRRQDCVGGPR